MLQYVFFIAIGFALLIIGADFLVDGSSTIARKYKIPEIIIGLTIVSIGTSMPELIVSLTSAFEGHSDLSIGNVVGSNIANLLLILGITAIIMPLKFEKTTKRYDIPIMFASSLLMFVLSLVNAQISRADGVFSTFFFILFILYTIRLAKSSMKNNSIEEENKKEDNIFIAIIKIVVGILMLKFGGNITVDNSVNVASLLGVSEKIIGVTIVAIGTSLPELITSIIAALKKNVDLAIGNIVGSCIFNLLLILGVSSIIHPIDYSFGYNIDYIILIFASVLLWLFANTGTKDTMTRLNGFMYLVIYVGYMMYVLI